MGNDRVIGPRGFRFFASPIDEPRARRASDVVLVAAMVSGLVVSAWVAAPPASFEKALAELLAATPSFFDGLWQLFGDLLVVWAVVLVLVASKQRRFSLVRDQLLAGLLALVVATVASRLVEGSWPELEAHLGGGGPPSVYPSVRVAGLGAVVLVASPYLSRPARRSGRSVVNLAAASAALLGATSPSGAAAAILIAVLAAAVVHLLVGSSGGRPGVGEVRAALDELGVTTSSIDAVDRQPSGAFLVHGVDGDGRALTVKVYGRDAHDSQWLARLWRTVWYRQEGPAPTLSRLQLAEHEALLTLLARQAGVPSQEVVTAGITAEGDALLALREHGVVLADLDAHEVSDGVLGGLWHTVEALHGAGIAHGQIDPRHVAVEDGTVRLVNLSAATVAPTEDQRRTDQAQAVVTSVVVVGAERGLAVAHEALGTEGVARVLPYLQMPALSRGLRPQVRRAKLDLDRLREQASSLAGVSPPDLVQLRRVSRGAVVQTGLLLVALAVLFSALAGLDLGDIASELRGATWWLVVVAALLAQAPRLAQAVSTLGACPRSLPLGPVYALQLAISYVNLAIPSAAARIAVNVRFFQRQGVPPGSAVAIGAIDGFSGFVVQILLLMSLLVFANISLDLQLEPATSGGPGRLLVGLGLVAAGAVVVMLVVRRWRAAIVGRATELAREAWATLRGLRTARRWAMLVGGNLAAELLFASSLGMFARALGYDVGLGEVLLVNVSVALFAGLMPVPGGIGVAEGALTVGLTAAGLPEPAALAVAVVYRLATFYLPPIWGWFAFRWLQANKYL